MSVPMSHLDRTQGRRSQVEKRLVHHTSAPTIASAGLQIDTCPACAE